MSSLILRCPAFRLAERRYAARVVFEEFLGMDCRVLPHEKDYWEISGTEGRRALIMPDSFFSLAGADWLGTGSLPDQPLAVWNTSRSLPGIALISRELPVIAGRINSDGGWFSNSGTGTARLGLDVLGATFFMLTRYEELVKTERDEHGRFPAKASLAYQEDFLHRPIIDEYIEVLWECLGEVFSGLRRKDRKYRVVPTHDLDRPFLFKSVKSYFHGLASHLWHGNVRLASAWLVQGSKRLKGAEYDPHMNGLIRLLLISEQFGIKSCINIMGAYQGVNDFGYCPSEKTIYNTVNWALSRGHHIGFHPGYETFCNADLFREQKERVEKIFGVVLSEGRQHYLRVKFPETWRIWDDAGFAFDSSAAYADISGFRCGVCRSFPVYDIYSRSELQLKERPLVLMDGTLKAHFNEGLTEQEALTRCIDLAYACRRYDGEFVILWHNSSLFGDWKSWEKVYLACLGEALGAK